MTESPPKFLPGDYVLVRIWGGWRKARVRDLQNTWRGYVYDLKWDRFGYDVYMNTCRAREGRLMKRG